MLNIMRRYQGTTASTKEGLLGQTKIVSNRHAKITTWAALDFGVPALGNGTIPQYGARHSAALFQFERVVSIVLAPVATQGEFDGR
jgi:hypothetical protein